MTYKDWYLYSVQLRLDIPTEPGESVHKSPVYRIAAPNVILACEQARRMVPGELEVTKWENSRKVIVGMRPVRSIVVTGCTSVSVFEGMWEDRT